MTTSLKTFIKSVRSSKTLADERAVIRRESALIRTAFKDSTLSHQTRRINIQKLLYLYIIGEKTHFGQIECIKLLASSNFVDKRLGYLATMLILDENQQVLTLLTNSLNNDMNHPNQFIVGLALTTLGNIASPELARDLYTDVEKIINGNNNYLKKKALMVASKIVEKDRDLAEIFIGMIPASLANSYHAVLLGTLKLFRSIYENSPELRSQLIKDNLVKIFDILKDLVSSGSNPEYDSMGLADPFLQISLIRTLALIFTDEQHHSETSRYLDRLNDSLTTVVSYTTYTKNSGSAILHEAVRSIFSVPNLDPALQVLGINTLGQLLSTKDNNNRYVALNTLLSVVSIEPLAVQRHRQTIVSCLNDADVSIKRRALELSFAILDESNIRILVKEILNFLENPVNNDKDMKVYIVNNIISILERKELIPNEKWKIDTLVRFVNLGGDTISPSNASQILALIMNIPNGEELKTYGINKIFKSGLEDQSKEGLNLIVVYLVGEYGDLLVNTKSINDELITESSLVDYLLALSKLQDENSLLISYLLTAALKLSTRIRDSKNRASLLKFIQSTTNSIDLNIQIKAVSYTVLFNEPDKIKNGILEKIPPPPIRVKESVSLTNKKKNTLIQSSSARQASSKQGSGNNNNSSTTNDLLLDLLGDDVATNNDGNNGTNADLLNDIFGSKPQASSAKNNILDLFDSPISNTPTSHQQNQSTSNAIEAYINSNIRVAFAVKSIGNGEAVIETIISNLTSSPISNISLLIAVPKSQKLTMSPISSNVIESNSTINQDLKVTGSVGGKIKLRVKVGYELKGLKESEQFDFGGFNETL